MQLLQLSLFSTYEQLFLIGFIIFLGQFVYSAIGFGSGMVTVSLLALIVGELNLFIPFYLLLCLPTEVIISFQERDKMDIKQIGIFMLFIFPAMFIGAYLLKAVADQRLVVFFGIIILLLSLYYLFFENKIHYSLNGMPWIALTGTLSGLLGGIYGISAPPLIFYFKALKLQKKDFRRSLLTIFLFMSFFRSGIYLFFHFYTLKTLFSVLLCLPFAVLGLACGAFIHHKVPELLFKKITSLVLMVNGLLIIIKNFI